MLKAEVVIYVISINTLDVINLFSTTSDYPSGINWLYGINTKLMVFNNVSYLSIMGNKSKKIYSWIINYADFMSNPIIKQVLESDISETIELSYFIITDTNELAISFMSMEKEMKVVKLTGFADVINSLKADFYIKKTYSFVGFKISANVQLITNNFVVYVDYNTVVVKNFENEKYSCKLNSYLDQLTENSYYAVRFYIMPSLKGVNTFFSIPGRSILAINHKCLFFTFINDLFCKTSCSLKTEKIVNRSCENNCPRDKPYIDLLNDECVSKCPKERNLLSYGYCLPSCEYGIGNQVIKSCYCNTKVASLVEGVTANSSNIGVALNTNTVIKTSCDRKCNENLQDNVINDKLCRECDLSNHFIQNKNCFAKCNEGWIYDDSKLCINCPTKLTQNNVCVETCQNEYRYIQQNTCVMKCSNNFDLNESNSENNNYKCTCSKRIEKGFCVETCSEGYGVNDQNECILCQYDQFIENNKCVLTCSKGSIYNDKKVCRKCESNLLTSNNKCVATCRKGFVPNKNRECVKCLNLVQGSECIEHCEPGWIVDQELKTCFKCRENQFVQMNKCVDSCKEGFIASKFNVCKYCPEGQRYNYNLDLCEKICLPDEVVNRFGECEKNYIIQDYMNLNKKSSSGKALKEDNLITILLSVSGTVILGVMILLIVFYVKKQCLFKPKKNDKAQEEKGSSNNAAPYMSSPNKGIIIPPQETVRFNNINELNEDIQNKIGIKSPDVSRTHINRNECIEQINHQCNEANLEETNHNIHDTTQKFKINIISPIAVDNEEIKAESSTAINKDKVNDKEKDRDNIIDLKSKKELDKAEY